MAENEKTEKEKALEQQLKELKLENGVLEAEKQIAKAKQEKIKAQFPSGEAQPVEGTITTNAKAGYVASLAAYHAMIHKADDIAKKINDLSLEQDNTRIMITDSLDYCGKDALLLQVSTQLSFWDTRLDTQSIRIQGLIGKAPAEARLFAPAISAALPIAEGLTSAVADIVGYFRMGYDIKGQSINISDTSLHSLVAGRIKYPVYLAGFHGIESSTIMSTFDKCIEKRTQLIIDMTLLREKIKTLTNKEEKEAHEKVFADSEALIKIFDDFGKVSTSITEGNNYSPLAAAVIQQYLKDEKITHLLYLAVISGGGEMVVGKGLFQWGKVSYLGGCVLTYILAERTGRIISADTLFESSNVKYNLCHNKLSAFNP